MQGYQNLYIFFITSLLLNITPGNDMLYVITKTVSQGIRAGITSAAGIFAGCFIHITAAVFGLSVIVMKSSYLFELIKYAGAAYLVFLGIKAIYSSAGAKLLTAESKQLDKWAIFKQGFFTNAVNPKVALFFLSFLPQFINIKSPNLNFHLFVLGLWFAIQGTIVLILVALFAGKTKQFFKTRNNYSAWLDRITGIVFIGLGIKIALTKKLN